MANILDDNEFVEVEGRYYANPQVSLDESNAFIDNLRSTQQANNQKIQTDTYNLGTEISSNLGGLTSPVGEGGAGDAGLSYFTSRYQTPQTNAAVENLRAVAQANALNQALQNEQEMWKKRYNDAYKNYQKRQYNRAYGGGSGGSGGGGGGGLAGKGEVETIIDSSEQTTTSPVGSKDVDYGSVGDFIAGRGAESITYTLNGKTYYANVYRQTGVSGNRYTGLDTSAGMSYEGQHALDYLNRVVSSGGVIKDSNGNVITPYRALTGSNGR